MSTVIDLPTIMGEQEIPERSLDEFSPRGFEVINGLFVEKPVGLESSIVGYELGTILRMYCKTNNLGWIAGPDAGFKCFPNTKLVRKPDIAFIAISRLATPMRGDCPIRPDLVVEIVSPNDKIYDLDQKIEDFLLVGVPLIWIVNPATRVVTVFRQDGSGQRLREPAELDGETVLPGFRCRLSDFFIPVATP
jgi:Uma2 family endonuclease